MLRKNANVTPVPKGLVLLNRLQFGFWSILAQFDVPADYAQVHREILHGHADSAPRAPQQLAEPHRGSDAKAAPS